MKRNILAEYQKINERLKSLEEDKKHLRDEIFTLMDDDKTDEITIDDIKAKREAIDQFRIDTKLAQKVLGDRYPEITTICHQVRLTVI